MQKPLRTKDNGIDVVFLLLVLLLLTIGLVMLWSASFAQSQYDTGYTSSFKYLKKQAACAALGLAAMYLLSRVPVSLWKRRRGLCMGSVFFCCWRCWRWGSR